MVKLKILTKISIRLPFHDLQFAEFEFLKDKHKYFPLEIPMRNNYLLHAKIYDLFTFSLYSIGFPVLK